MRGLYVKLGYNEAVIGKKEFLSAQINMLQLLKSLKSYKNLRRRELILKTKFKTKLTDLKKKINELQTMLPKEVAVEETEIKTTRQTKEEYQDVKAKSDIESQLKAIKEQLVRLG